jgi:hypothetical protein
MREIVAVLNCYLPANGRNAAQVILRSDGAAEIRGDEDLGRRALRNLIKSGVSTKVPDFLARRMALTFDSPVVPLRVPMSRA